MRKGRSSTTAGIVAAARSMGELLPDHAHIAEDPYGKRFLGGWARRAVELSPPAVVVLPPIAGWLLYMQVRTRALDDVLLDFVAKGGKQVVLLGAGYDCRALRFADRLGGATFFEIDHPATQERKRAGIAGLTGARGPSMCYLRWDFESQSVADLPRALREIGHAPAEPTLTIWEGVTMYLTESALAASVAAVRGLSAPGSLLALTYFERSRLLQNPTLLERVVRAAVASFGEPFRFGWDPGELAPWLGPHGFEVLSDHTEIELAAKLLVPGTARKVKSSGRHIAVARMK